MEISLDNGQANYKIQSYQAGRIRINQQDYSQPLLLSLDQLIVENLPAVFADFDKAFLESLDLKQYEVILLGTGERLQFPEWDLLEQAQIWGSPLEVMATDAACRTFTVLASEGRQVLAILFP